MLDKAPPGRLVGGAMLARPSLLAHPLSQPPVGHVDIGELLPGHEVALEVVDAVLHLSFVLRSGRTGGADQKAVM